VSLDEGFVAGETLDPVFRSCSLILASCGSDRFTVSGSTAGAGAGGDAGCGLLGMEGALVAGGTGVR
jgi:hypothetical protein